MYTNGVNTYNKIRDDKPQMTSQNFNFDGEAFQDLMDKEEASGGGLRETARELAEDESILSTDEENRAMARRGQGVNEGEVLDNKETPKFPEDKARLLKLMDMNNKINGPIINVSKSKKEVENTIGKSLDDNDEPEDITSVVAKIALLKKEEQDASCKTDIETEVNTNNNKEFDNSRHDDSQVLHETEEELLEDESILSTEEENLEMARRNSQMNRLSDEDYKTSEDDMLFLNDIVAMNNQMNVNVSDVVTNTQNVLSALISQTQTRENRMDLSELTASDVDCIIGLLRSGMTDSSHFTNDDNDELDRLSKKFIELLKDSIINKKVFRIDFDNDISVIIRINTEGKLITEFLTNDDVMETHLKNNLHILKERFEALNVDYEDITIRNTNKEI